jgi:hypothetical protein
MGSLVAAVAALAALFSHAASARQPTTILVRSHGTIAAFAQDATTMAWFAPGGSGCNTIHVRSIKDPIGIDLPSLKAANVTCRFVRSTREAVRLAVAGDSANVLWSLPQQSPLALDYLLGAGVRTTADRAERRFLEVAHTARGVGQWLGGIAGDGRTLAYAVTTVDWTDEAACLAGTGSCALVKSGGGVYVVRNRTPVLVPRTGPAVGVAVSNTAVAYVPTGGIAKNGRPLAGADLPIEIVDSTSGAEIASVVPQGVPAAISLSPHVLATLERTTLGLRLAWYDAATGRVRGSVPVPRTTSPQLTSTDRLIVFHVGRSLRAVDARTHRTRLLATTAASPIGLSLEGTRLAWAENLAGRSRIQALYVNGSG